MEKFEQVLISDTEYRDGGLFWKTTGKARKVGKRVGGVDNRVRRFTITADGVVHRIQEHRAIFWLHNGYWPGEIDHINGDPLDNRIENLRECTSSQNKYNVGPRKSSTTGIKNVYWFKPRNKYKVQMSIEGKLTTFGYFDDIELAELVAREAREKYHGEYAYASPL